MLERQKVSLTIIIQQVLRVGKVERVDKVQSGQSGQSGQRGQSGQSGHISKYDKKYIVYLYNWAGATLLISLKGKRFRSSNSYLPK